MKIIPCELQPDNPRTMANQMGEFLSRFHWDWFVTITFRDEPTDYGAWRRTYAWLRSLEKSARRHVGAYIVIEYHRWRAGRNYMVPHSHLLVTGVAGLKRTVVWKRTFDRYGRTRILPYDPQKGASYYVAKYVAKEVFERGEWDFWRPEVIQAAQIPLRPGI